MNKIRLYIYPLYLGFVIVPLLVWPTVVVVGITLSFLMEMLFSNSFMHRVFPFWNYNLGYWLNIRFCSAPYVALVGNLLA